MNDSATIQKAFYVTVISLALAFLFNFLFFEKIPGISVLLMTVALTGTVWLFGLRQQISVRKTLWLLSLITFFALMPSIRANEFLTFLNICATFGLLILWAHELVGTPAWVMRLREYLLLVTLVPLRMLGQALSTVTLLGQIHSSVKQHDVWLRMGKGVLIAAPILLIFGGLFSHADLAFAQFLKGFIDISLSERTIQYLVLLAFAFVAALSFLSYIFSPRHVKAAVARKSSAAQPGRGIEVLVALGLIAALFLLFIGFQVTYLFGGEANIINAGFTYAEYARRGFFELLAVAMLSLVVLLAAEKYAGAESASWRRDPRFLIPALILIVEVGVVMASAFTRLSLHIDAYGMTLLRFYVAGFMMLLVTLFILLAYKFIQSKREEFFAFGALLALAAFLIIVNLVNPDPFIARYNIEHYQRTGKLDLAYMRLLSVDAEPWKIALYHMLEGQNKEDERILLQEDKERLQTSSADWQSANLSRARALKLLQGF